MSHFVGFDYYGHIKRKSREDYKMMITDQEKKTLGENIRYFMKRTGVQEDALAEYLKVSAPVCHKLKNGAAPGDISELLICRIADLFWTNDQVLLRGHIDKDIAYPDLSDKSVEYLQKLAEPINKMIDGMEGSIISHKGSQAITGCLFCTISSKPTIMHFRYKTTRRERTGGYYGAIYCSGQRKERDQVGRVRCKGEYSVREEVPDKGKQGIF
jgi:plasmid maintenance system antidote protein VapI